jgi:predicted PurR-regulated permease PerM
LTGLALLAFVAVSPFLVPLVWAGVLAYATWSLSHEIEILRPETF